MTTPVWFITAASSGFGREIALQALQRGHTVVATARNADRIAHLRDAGAHTLALDPGDVVKGGKTIVDILTGTGVAEGKKLPVRIVLGTDCEETIRGKIKQTEGILEEWKDVIRSTDY
ncbi:unnamed protein product [Clonostachys rosea f. rosea IK726]|uniref:Uncharacterized protein n=1 Tax=Clonostachys rosea f. rosea IK726 TaxID=1349383 RepID=A0ACA9T786_BIOOC|nr:unnamed protein product [Clonostachys rosea f. rosea IK726]